MKGWKKKLEAMAAAVSFAEAGDWKTAEELMQEAVDKRLHDQPKKRSRTTDRPRARVYRT